MIPISKNLPHIADPEQRKQTEALHLHSLGNSEDNANACIYLLSDASRLVTWWMEGIRRGKVGGLSLSGGQGDLEGALFGAKTKNDVPR